LDIIYRGGEIWLLLFQYEPEELEKEWNDDDDVVDVDVEGLVCGGVDKEDK